MTGFILGAALLVGLTLVLLLLPLRQRASSAADLSRTQINTAIYRDQIDELERDRAGGELAQADYDQALAELQRRLLEDSTPAAGAAAGNGAIRVAPDDTQALPWALGFGLPFAAVLLYLLLGNPAAINPLPPADPQRFGAEEIERMVSGLAAKLEKEPGNLEGWAMLARSYKAMGRLPEAARAYERAGTLLDTDANLLIDYADTLASATGFDAKVLALMDKALKLDPAHVEGLWLRGTAFFRNGQYAKAVHDWEALLKAVPAGSEAEQVVRANIAEARQKLSETKKLK